MAIFIAIRPFSNPVFLRVLSFLSEWVFRWKKSRELGLKDAMSLP